MGFQKKKKHKFILSKNQIIKNEPCTWKIKINKITGWMAFGVVYKDKLIKNQYKFNGITNQPHGCILVSSNKYIWNNNLINQNNCFINDLPYFKNDDEINFTYCPVENAIKFKLNNFEGNLKRIFQESEDILVPCCVMINKNDEINL